MKDNLTFSLPDPLGWFEVKRFTGASSFSWHSHPNWQMSLSLEGVFAFVMRDGTKQRFKPGEIALIPPGVPHQAFQDFGGGRYAQLFFRHFSPELFPEPARKFNIPSEDIFSATAPLAEMSALVDKIEMRCRPTDSLSLSWRRLLCNTFLLQGAELFCRQCDKSKTRIPQVVPRALAYLEAEYRKDIAVEDVARHVGLSVSRFSAVFRQAIGCSPMRQLGRLRLSRAQIMLLNECPVKEAAMQNGFRSVEYFCRFFKQQTGQTPSAFRKQPFSF